MPYSQREQKTRELLALSVCMRTQHYREYGVAASDLLRAATLLEELGAMPLVEGKNPVGTARQFNLLAEAVALLSCNPGGVDIFGLRFETDVPTVLKPKTIMLTQKRSKKYSAAQQAALQAGKELIRSWGDEKPLIGYAQLGTTIHTLLYDHYHDLDVENRVQIHGEVQDALFVPLLPTYERLYGRELVQTSIRHLYE